MVETTGSIASRSAGLAGTAVLEAGTAIDQLILALDKACEGLRAGRHRVIVACPRERRGALAAQLPERLRQLPILALEDWWRDPLLDTPLVGFLPANAVWWRPRWDLMPSGGPWLKPWLPRLNPIRLELPVIYDAATAWIATASLLPEMFEPGAQAFGIAEAVQGLGRRGTELGYASAGEIGSAPPAALAGGMAPLRRDATVLAIVPHYRCEAWLAQCLQSLTRQTRPPEAIVVVDDGSPEPPRDIVARFPSVTLMRTRENGGPYRILQSLVEATRFDAFMLQDADDWSTDDRLELQLAEAERTGAELIGCLEIRLGEPVGGTSAVCYPLDASASFLLTPDCQVLHPTSLVGRDLIRRVGGYSAGLKFGADMEFQVRAHYAARVVNVPRFGYFRRLRPGSLWTSTETGEHSEVRQRHNAAILAKADQNAQRVAASLPPDLAPMYPAEPVPLDHVTGPVLPLG
jgi:hypothetical protein